MFSGEYDYKEIFFRRCCSISILHIHHLLYILSFNVFYRQNWLAKIVRMYTLGRSFLATHKQHIMLFHWNYLQDWPLTRMKLLKGTLPVALNDSDSVEKSFPINRQGLVRTFMLDVWNNEMYSKFCCQVLSPQKFQDSSSRQSWSRPENDYGIQQTINTLV